ncbi:Uncharacterised protein [Bordetella pertussis]|nr:Uncharacterised protein [Bordetella pertussis]CFP68015.1 Uncharacterised protein [Bordetella pertussis]
MARSSASTTWGGAVKSGSPIPRLMMSRPAACRACASLKSSTTWNVRKSLVRVAKRGMVNRMGYVAKGGL